MNRIRSNFFDISRPNLDLLAVLTFKIENRRSTAAANAQKKLKKKPKRTKLCFKIWRSEKVLVKFQRTIVG